MYAFGRQISSHAGTGMREMKRRPVFPGFDPGRGEIRSGIPVSPTANLPGGHVFFLHYNRNSRKNNRKWVFLRRARNSTNWMAGQAPDGLWHREMKRRVVLGGGSGGDLQSQTPGSPTERPVPDHLLFESGKTVSPKCTSVSGTSPGFFREFTPEECGLGIRVSGLVLRGDPSGAWGTGSF